MHLAEVGNDKDDTKSTALYCNALVRHVRISLIVNSDEDKEVKADSKEEHEKGPKENLYYCKAQKVKRELRERIWIEEPNLQDKKYYYQYKETESKKLCTGSLTEQFKEKSYQFMDIYQGLFEKFENYFNLEEIRKMMEKGLNIFYFRATRYLKKKKKKKN